MIRGGSKDERLKVWYNHFNNLLGKDPQLPDDAVEEEIPKLFKDIQINDQHFTLDELKKAKQSLTLGKACGPDDIPPDILKLCNFDDIILKFANKLLVDGCKPEVWSKINLIPVPKTGDLSDPGNYRGISLSSVTAKLVNKMILNRIQPTIDPLLRNNQNGFRPSRSTMPHILALRRLLECKKL